MGTWIYQNLIDETLDWFVNMELPDAEPGWEDLPWSVEVMGKTDDHRRWWTIAVDIPTSVKWRDCWLTFRIVEPGGAVREPVVMGARAVRSGQGEHVNDVYIWDDEEGLWELVPDDDEDEIS